MEEFWILIFVSFFAALLDKAESVQLEDLPLQTFDEICGGWLDNAEAEDFKTPAPTNFGQNVHHQIGRQNTQIGQIEPNSTDQLGQIEPNSTDQLRQIGPNLTDQNPPLTESDHSGQIGHNLTDQNPPLTESDHFGQIEPNSTDQNPPLKESDHSGQIEPNSTDQNPPLTESDQSDNAKNAEEQNETSLNKNIAKDEQKRKIIDKFHEMKEAFKQKGKYSTKEWNQIDDKIAKHLKVSRKKIYKWKKEFGLSRRNLKNERKNLVEKFDQKKAELTRAGFKRSYKNELDESVAKELGLSFTTIYKWKRKLGQAKPQHKYAHSEQMELLKRYYQIKYQNPIISDGDTAKMLKIGTTTLVNWKKQFKRQQLHPNFVDGHSVEENAAGSNVQEIANSNSGNI